MTPGFHTIGLLLHDECTAIEQLAGLGFAAVAIRPRLSGLHASLPDFGERAEQIAAIANAKQVEIVIDLNGVFLADPRVAIGPSLASQDADEAGAAAAELRKWIEVAPQLGASVISFRSGRVAETHHGSAEASLEQLAGCLEPLVELAVEKGVRLALSPMMGDLIASVAQYERFLQWLSPDCPLAVAPDVGEMLLGGEFPVGERLARHHRRIACVYLCEPETESERARDQRIGRGDIDWLRVWRAVESSGFDGPAIFRVFGHNELGFELATEAMAVLADQD